MNYINLKTALFQDDLQSKMQYNSPDSTYSDRYLLSFN